MPNLLLAQPIPAQNIWAAMMPAAAAPWTTQVSHTDEAPLTPLEVMAGGVRLPPDQGGAAARDTEPAVTRFVAPEIRSDGSPGGLTRSDQLVLTATFIAALALSVVTLIGWRRNRVGWR